MVKPKGKKLTIHTEKRQEPVLQKAPVPMFESPFDIRDDINRMFYESAWVKPWWNNWIVNQALEKTPENRMKVIPVDFVDTGNGYQITTEMPGINKKNIEVIVTSKTISICGQTETHIRKENEGYVKRERGYSTLCRYLRFPEDVNPDNAEAKLINGILHIQVNKKTPSKPGTLVLVQ
jgi:HSP20 family protein